MARLLSLMLCLAVIATTSSTLATTRDTAHGSSANPRHFTDDRFNSVLTSDSSSKHLAGRETTGPDTFALYGGPEHPTEGKFQLAGGITPDWGAGNGLPWTGAPGEWTPVDLTDLPVFWHRSQFNAQTLGTTQPSPNHAMWCGVEADDPFGAGWSNLPGYGNGWNDAMLYESAPLADDSIPQTVDLEFYFHHDTEPGFDYFLVEYDSAGIWTTVMASDSSDMDASNVFNAPGVTFTSARTAPIDYAGSDYGGDFRNQIRIRMRVFTDGGWSDEDGLWPTRAGAAQVDEITMTTSQGTFSENYEAVLVPPAKYLFHPDKAPFAGDFAEVYPRLTDIDPCRDNDTPVIGMIDFGQIIRNGPGLGGDTQIIGGSVSAGVNYGIVGNHVVNYNGGLSFGQTSLTNEIWSPDIYWDLPGTEDDAVEISGAFIRHSTWWHMPLSNGIFMVWRVRSALAGEPYSNWANHGFVYFWGGTPLWFSHTRIVSEILQPGPERVQMAFGTWDYASVFGFPGTAATPAPVFDNAAFYKFRVAGPTFATRNIDLAQDGFPVGGAIDVSSPATRGVLDIPFSMARDVNTGEQFNVAGDSVVFDVASVIPGATVSDLRMIWALSTNAVFEDALRAAPARVEDANVVAGAAGTVWTGEVVADTAKTFTGAVIENHFFVDLPDVDFMYPGDVLHYYIQAIDSDGRTTTLPADTSGFSDFVVPTSYDRSFTVRCLPTITDTAGSQPVILVWNGFGRNGGEDEWVTAFQQLGYAEGVDFDSYTTMGPSSNVSNGLGSAGVHGANADQLAGYNHLFYFHGDASVGLSNGSNIGTNDKSNDIDLLEQWHARAGGARNCAYFGDFIAAGMASGSAESLGYLSSTMSVAFGDSDVRDVIGQQTAPVIVPNAATSYPEVFSTNYVAYGGCIGINKFDQIQPAGVQSEAGHLFTDANGVPYPPDPDPAVGGVASVINNHGNGLDITFPYSSAFICSVQERSVNLAARTVLIREILSLFVAGAGTSPVVSAPKIASVELSVLPNPFNPQTTVKFTAALGSKGSVKVFNLRGELVRTLHDGEFLTQDFTWNGDDDRGASVASGVYVIRAEANGNAQTKKAALVK